MTITKTIVENITNEVPLKITLHNVPKASPSRPIIKPTTANEGILLLLDISEKTRIR